MREEEPSDGCDVGLSWLERFGSNLGSNLDSYFARLASVRGGGCPWWGIIPEDVNEGDGMYWGSPQVEVNGIGDAKDIWHEGDMRGEPKNINLKEVQIPKI